MKIISAITIAAYLLMVPHVLLGHGGVAHAEHWEHHGSEINISSHELFDNAIHYEHSKTHLHDSSSETHNHDRQSENHQHNVKIALSKKRNPLNHLVSITHHISLSNYEWGNIKSTTRRYVSVWLPPEVYLSTCVFLL